MGMNVNSIEILENLCSLVQVCGVYRSTAYLLTIQSATTCQDITALIYFIVHFFPHTM